MGRFDLGGSLKVPVAWYNGSKIQSVRISTNLASYRSARHPDSNGANDTQIRDCMQKLEKVKVQVRHGHVVEEMT